MSVSMDEVKYIASLARLEFKDSELLKLTEDLSNIVDMANENSKINVDGVKETIHILENTNVFREDEVKPSFSREEMLMNAPSKEAGCINVPKVVE